MASPDLNPAASWRQTLADRKEPFIADLIELLRIPSVSASEAHTHEVKRAAEWVSSRMKRAGIENIQVSPTGPHACVYGDYCHAPGKPTVLIYGHFDVQPADPLELWDSPPFEPVITDGRIYARGACDMKGNLLIVISAFEAILSSQDSFPVNVKLLFEGQEEIGSRDLGPYVASHRDQLSCDIVLTPDGAQWTEDRPAMWMGFKGLCSLQIDLETASMDLHSGLFGGGVPNAAHALVELLGTFRDASGNILVKGFYDQVTALTELEREKMNEVPFDAEAYKTGIGIDALVGEPDYTTYERTWGRPTLEINGLWGGYQGDGIKTVIPAKAHAKISCRLVAHQDPVQVLDSLEQHIRLHAPAGARVTVTRHEGKARAFLLPLDYPGVKLVADVLAEEYGCEPYFVRVGGTLPIMDMFLQELGTYTLDVGFGMDDERMHSPNEFTRLASLERGQIVYAKLFERLAQFAPSSLKIN